MLQFSAAAGKYCLKENNSGPDVRSDRQMFCENTSRTSEIFAADSIRFFRAPTTSMDSVNSARV